MLLIEKFPRLYFIFLFSIFITACGGGSTPVSTAPPISPITPELSVDPIPVLADERLNTCITETAKNEGWTSVDQVKHLNCSGRQIASLMGIGNLYNLETFIIGSGYNQLNGYKEKWSVDLTERPQRLPNINDTNSKYIIDLSPLTSLPKLSHFELLYNGDDNKVYDYSPISQLTKLNTLVLDGVLVYIDNDDYSDVVNVDLSKLVNLKNLVFKPSNIYSFDTPTTYSNLPDSLEFFKTRGLSERFQPPDTLKHLVLTEGNNDAGYNLSTIIDYSLKSFEINLWDIPQTNVDDIRAFISKQTGLQRLILQGVYWNLGDDLEELTNLESLDLRDVSSDTLDFSALNTLTSLYIEPISSSEQERVVKLPKQSMNIIHLVISGFDHEMGFDSYDFSLYSSIEELRIDSTPALVEELVLPQSNKLKSLKITNIKIKSGVIPNYPVLEHLSLNLNSFIYPDEEITLPQANNLISLFINGAKIKDGYVPNYPKLESLSLYSDSDTLSFENLAFLENMHNLKGLGISVNGDIDEQYFSPIANLGELKELSLEYIDNAPVDTFNFLSELTRLEYLNFNAVDINSLTPLANLTSLTNLTINDGSKMLAYARYIRSGSPQGNVSDLSPLAGLINLKVLNLINNQISDLTPLVGLTNLVHLGLSQNEISDLTPLTELTNLSLLWLASNSISDFSVLADLDSLEILYLPDNQISQLGGIIKNFTANPKVYLENNPIEGCSEKSLVMLLPYLGWNIDRLQRDCPIE
ncbi:leucine-rich repeat domain-containing protein [Colwellia sp. RE-S-Sl-9]